VLLGCSFIKWEKLRIGGSLIKQNWKSIIPALKMSGEDYIRQNAMRMTDHDIVHRLASAGVTTTVVAIEKHRYRMGIIKTGGTNSQVIGESPFVKYDSPLVIEADRIAILGDIQFPYHEAAFINKVLDLCRIWNVRHCVLAGDVIECASLTHFDPNWEGEGNSHGIPDEALDDLIAIKQSLVKNSTMAGKLEAIIEKHGRQEKASAGNVSEEWGYAKKDLAKLIQQFDDIVWEVGNHEGRVLRQMQSPFLPDDLKRMFVGEEPKVRIAPYYYTLAKSSGVEWRITHPKSSAKGDSKWYASKYLTNVIMAHNHHLVMQRDRSGKFWAIEIGCCVDERRLPYVSQRDSKGDAHVLGAAILRDGKCWLLHEDVDWETLAKL